MKWSVQHQPYKALDYMGGMGGAHTALRFDITPKIRPHRFTPAIIHLVIKVRITIKIKRGPFLPTDKQNIQIAR